MTRERLSEIEKCYEFRHVGHMARIDHADVRDLISALRDAWGKLAVASTALKYCAGDDSMAVDLDGNYDHGSADHWKQMRARTALKEMEGEK